MSYYPPSQWLYQRMDFTSTSIVASDLQRSNSPVSAALEYSCWSVSGLKKKWNWSSLQSPEPTMPYMSFQHLFNVISTELKDKVAVMDRLSSWQLICLLLPLAMTSSRGTQTKKAPMSRACHGYGNTCGDWVMGTTGMGMVLDFSTLWHIMYPYCSIMGMIRVNYNKVGLIFTALKLVFSDTLLVFFW